MADIRSDVTAGVAEVSAEEELRICLFLMGADTYAIPVEALTEIIIPQKIFPIPTTPAYVAGIINLRGNIIPIVDIRPVLALSQEAASGQIAILRYNQMPIGIVVDAVVEIASVPRNKIVEVPAEHALQHPGKERNRFVKSIIHREGGIAALLDIDKVLDAIKLA